MTTADVKFTSKNWLGLTLLLLIEQCENLDDEAVITVTRFIHRSIPLIENQIAHYAEKVDEPIL